jgi:hypothetical protein
MEVRSVQIPFAPFQFGLEIWCEARSHLAPIARPQSARAHASLFFCSIVEEPFASVNRVDWNRPQPGAPSASPTADPVPSRMAAEKALARAFASSSDARRCAVGLPTPCMGAYSKFRGRHLPRKPAQKVSRLDLGPAEANRVLLACRSATCMYERVRRTGATGARLVLALGGHTPNSETIIRPQSLLRRHPRSTLVLRRRIGCSRSVVVP